jgi:hypothetical protein
MWGDCAVEGGIPPAIAADGGSQGRDLGLGSGSTPP